MVKKQQYLRALFCVTILLLFIFTDYLRAENPHFRLNGLQVKNQQEQTVTIIDELFTAPDIFVENIHYKCDGSIELYPIHVCDQAQLTFDLQDNRLELTGQVNYDVLQQLLKLDAVNSDKTLILSYDSAEEIQQINLKDLPVNKWLPPLLAPIKDNLSALVSGEVNVALTNGMVTSADRIEFSGLDYEHSDDLIGLGLSGVVDFDWDIQRQRLSAEVEIEGGEALLKQVYINFSEFPLHLSLHINIKDDQYYIDWGLSHPDVFVSSGHMSIHNDLELGPWQSTIEVMDSTRVNKHITNSVLEIYGFSQNQADGGFSISANGQKSQINHLYVEFKDFSYANLKRKLAIAGLNGQIDWHWQQTSQPSTIDWQSLILSGMPIKAASMSFNLSEDEFSLYGRHQFPVFDGAILIERLSISRFMGIEPSTVKMDAEIEPISLLPISKALDWPHLAGQISGQLPGMVKTGNVIEFEGILHLSVFDGSVRFENLSMERLFGVAPVIAADVDINLLDLALLTQTYDFGLITGRLSGKVNQLRITNWKLDRMDATIYSVETESSQQTISQKAIENISAIGGIKGAVSRTFLRFFDRFKYKKIKLSCKLHNSVCKIGGLDNQQGRFTIVEGGGLPKINIVGYAREIDWDVFIKRLLNASYDS